MTAKQDDARKDSSRDILRSKQDETPEAYGRRLADFLYERATKSLDDSRPKP